MPESCSMPDVQLPLPFEEWRPVPGWEGFYEVSNLGRVWSCPREWRLPSGTPARSEGRIRKTHVEPVGGRENVDLTAPGRKRKMAKVHRLVAEAFLGPCPPGMECCHNDGNASHNVVGNLRWDTPSANQRDRARHGTGNHGERCASAKLTAEQVNEIRAMRARGALMEDIAAAFGVSRGAVGDIVCRRTWVHLP